MTTIVEDSGGAGTAAIYGKYPEVEEEPIALIPKVSLVSNVMKEGIDL